jgi:hypothetical protein
LNSRATIAIGWDVGGWNCDKNTDSRDALVVLGAQAELLGQPWRGNLRHAINDANNTATFLTKIFSICRVERPPLDSRVTIAIDAPLAFPASLVALLTSGRVEPNLRENATYPYLYRFCERRLATVPLSVVKDMIGSQSTKAIHATTKFAPIVEALGVWSDGGATRFIEIRQRADVSQRKVRNLGPPAPLATTKTSSTLAFARLSRIASRRPRKLLNLLSQTLLCPKAGYGCPSTNCDQRHELYWLSSLRAQVLARHTSWITRVQ